MREIFLGSWRRGAAWLTMGMVVSSLGASACAEGTEPVATGSGGGAGEPATGGGGAGADGGSGGSTQTSTATSTTTGTLTATETDTTTDTGTGTLTMMVAGDPWINELHYNNTGVDSAEGVEIAGPAGTSLAGWKVALYNGSNGASYLEQDLVGTLPNQQNGLGTLWFMITEIQNGDPDGVALIAPNGTVREFYSYGGVFQATNGPASGETSIAMGVAEDNDTEPGESLQRTGFGLQAGAFDWDGPLPATPGQPNTNQTFN